MATPPRGKSNPRRPASRAKKPTTIDLDAKDVKVTPPADGAADSAADGNAAADADIAPKTASGTAPAAKPAASKSSADMAQKSTPARPSKDTSTKAASIRKSAKLSKDTKADSASPAGIKKHASSKSANTAKSTPPPSKQAPSRPNKVKTGGNTGFGKLAVAGIIGGLITLGGAGAMQYTGLLPSVGNNTAPQPITQKIPATDLAPLRSKIADLQAKVENLGSTAVPTIDLTPIENRVTALENSPQAFPATDNSNSETALQLQELKDRLDALKASAQELTTRLARLESIKTSVPDQTATSTLIDAAIAPLINSSRRTSAKLGELENKFAALTTKIDEEVNERIKKFDEKLKNAATGEKLAKSVAINALKFAIENGDPYSAVLTSLETLVGPSRPLDLLKPYASIGIPTDKMLLDEFHELQSTILLAATNDPDAGITDRLMSSIRSLVTISSDQALPGDSPEAVVSRIDANLKSGDFGAAVSEWKTLPDPAQQVSKSWMEKLGQRMDADRQMSKLMQAIQSPTIQSGG